MKLTVIIPTLNEADRIGPLIDHLHKHSADHMVDVIVADGGSGDGTQDIVRSSSARLLDVGKRGRAVQMNAAAQVADGDVLYFLHADTTPPVSYASDILEAIGQENVVGSYRFRFDDNTGLKRINSWVTRYGLMVCRGGDQSMFVKRSFFDAMGGFDERYVIMEDFDFIRRSRKRVDWHVIPKEIEVSSRKYDNNSYMRVQLANLMAFTMFNFGASVPRIKSWYEKLLGISYE